VAKGIPKKKRCRIAITVLAWYSTGELDGAWGCQVRESVLEHILVLGSGGNDFWVSGLCIPPFLRIFIA
jgi:hypothetical protein